ncbi:MULTISPECIES: N-acetylmuramoyl-L-alanine amidase [unclassified Streptomyces]|uniref:peptidoglycan recognition protein family protein n=1 Tax=unclassified Streptomyces TaxID=2593676 RepID=UPI001369B9A0|nr:MULTISPECIES: N-acetylmuramoyl-L-alanine amidase [unclassified Streptomyces]NDZ98473.1 N-acetylmuramoyl-L-alanine amidase [Streptomyces sp. SID10116]MYY79800.1 N-acetylmuramoyl-L-alanine amidase [Streptomyces sp. SID335]MYZ16016.1 N-acetylmuramoyl-L-alanine amidase [Streptomyces sp. SID337]NDZ84463.1 N-acetylmuramoyl-L-alanine amidase [Streptomyces sp. SID10115]NEB43426.1 N-acetylmuramoyl-L-alanine amidase [Streptomyces sp. SID339]
MAQPLTPDALLAALRREGVRVAEKTGWRTHNRNHKGPWGPVNGVVIHHTAGTSSLSVCWTGTSDLPGPLCHTHLAKSGTATMLSAGRANHAGTFAQNAHTSVVNESPTHPRPDSSEPVDGNAHYYGIEIENLGNGRDPYPAAQYDAAVRWAAAICRAHSWSADSVIGHKEGTRRKIDPSFDMDQFRKDVDERLAHPAGWTPGDEPDQEETVPHTLGRYETADRPLTPGKWTTLPIEGVDLLTGARAYQAMAQITAELPDGATLQGRFYHYRTDGSRWTAGLSERQGTAGSTFADFHNSGSIAATEKLRFETCYWPVETDDQRSITITTSRLRGLYWK